MKERVLVKERETENVNRDYSAKKVIMREWSKGWKEKEEREKERERARERARERERDKMNKGKKADLRRGENQFKTRIFLKT